MTSGMSYLCVSGEVKQPLDKPGIVCACHLRCQHTHSLGTMASKLAFLHHLKHPQHNVTAWVKHQLITIWQQTILPIPSSPQTKLYTNTVVIFVFISSEPLRSVYLKIYLKADMLQEDLQERLRQLLQLIQKMTVITYTQIKCKVKYGL